jgi:hypothetical protein
VAAGKVTVASQFVCVREGVPTVPEPGLSVTVRLGIDAKLMVTVTSSVRLVTVNVLPACITVAASGGVIVKAGVA